MRRPAATSIHVREGRGMPRPYGRKESSCGKAGKILSASVRKDAFAAGNHVGILGVLSPADWIIYDVLPDSAEISLIADNMFVEIALPEWRTLGPALFVHALCRGRFERAHNEPKLRSNHF